MDSDAPDSEEEFHADQDKILLDEVSRNGVARTRPRPTEIQPLGLDSDTGDEDDDDDDEEEEEAQLKEVGQYRDLLQRARLREVREEIVSDAEDDDDEEEEASGTADAEWAASRRFRYAGAGEEEREEEEEEEDEETAELMEAERRRVRRRMLGAGRQSDLPADAPLTSGAEAGGRSAGESATRSLVRISGSLPRYEAPAPEVRADRRLLQRHLRQHCPDMADANAEKCRLERRLRPLVGVADSELTRAQSLLKWRYVLLCAYLRLRASAAPAVHKHPVCRLLAESADAVADLVVAKKRRQLEEAAEIEPEDDDKEEEQQQQQQQEEEEEEASGPSAGHRPIYREMQRNQPVQLHRRQQRQRLKKRKAGDSNPRVKLRHKFKKALVRRRSQVPDVRPEVNRYSGEAFGIRAGLVKARKFK